MKRLAVLVSVLCIVATSQAVMLADFETGVDGFIATGTPASILATSGTAGAVTSGAQCLKVTHKPTNYWPIRWVAPTVPAKLGKLRFDLTCFAADWPTQPWTRFCEKIAVQSDGGGGGWAEYSTTTANWTNRLTGEQAAVDWGAWDGDCIRTCTIDISNYNLTGATYFQVNFSFNCGTEGLYYIDNLHFVDEPYNPNPANGGTAVAAGTDSLSWSNAIETLEYAQVWFGEVTVPSSDPNYPTVNNYKSKLSMISKITNPGAASTATIPSALEIGKKYAWLVEGFKGCGDPNNFTEPNYPGLLWTFTGTSHNPPVANAGADQFIYSYTNVDNIEITLNAAGSTDDGEIAPLTYKWTKLEGPDAIFTDPNVAAPMVTLQGGLANLTETGAAAPYVFQVEAFDGEFYDTDTVTVYVNSNSCKASIEAGGFYFYGDIAGPAGAGDENRDCKVDLYDFAEMALNWLGCSDTFENCN